MESVDGSRHRSAKTSNGWMRSARQEGSVAGFVRSALRRCHTIKTFNQAGPCTRKRGNPDIGGCQTDCTHRLELAAARADHRKAIGLILGKVPGNDCMMRVWWQAQLLSHLVPFADLGAEMLADPRVQAALVGVSSHSVEMLDEHQREAARALVKMAA